MLMGTARSLSTPRNTAMQSIPLRMCTPTWSPAPTPRVASTSAQRLASASSSG